jgi:hypothetical protein
MSEVVLFINARRDQQFVAVFDAIRQMMTPAEKKGRKIGFGRGDGGCWALSRKIGSTRSPAIFVPFPRGFLFDTPARMTYFM